MKPILSMILALVMMGSGLCGWGLRSAAAASTSPGSDAGAATSDSAGIPNSQSKVSVQTWFPGPSTNNGRRSLSIRLKINHGWHVNAHPASLPFLVPTAVKAQVGGDAVPIKVSYPGGHASGIVLNGTSIDVYQNNTTVNAQLPPATAEKAKKAGVLTIAVQIQACSDKGICLPPANIYRRVPWT